MKKGISLIVLIVTIIVMIILSAVIIMTLRDTGIIDMAQDAKKTYNDKALFETLNMVTLNEVATQEQTATSIKAAIENEIDGAIVTNMYGEPTQTTDRQLKVMLPGDDETIYTVNTTGEIKKGLYLELTKAEAIAKGFDYLTTQVTKTIAGYIGTDETVIIPCKVDGVTITTIDTWFAQYSNIKQVIIPNTVTTIIGKPFSNSALVSVVVPDSVTDAGGAFEECRQLKNITLPKNIDSLGVFCQGCSSLETVIIPDNISSIVATFAGCSALKNVTLSKNLEEIGGWTFLLCTNLETIEFPNSLKEIGTEAFKSCSSLTSVTIPSSVETIGPNAFANCSALTSITVGSNAVENLLRASGYGGTINVVLDNL